MCGGWWGVIATVLASVVAAFLAIIATYWMAQEAAREETEMLILLDHEQ